jgi:hypothetical protein
MREILSPERVMEIYEAKIRILAKNKWMLANCPENRDWEFWFEAEKEYNNRYFVRPLKESALPDYG